MELNNRGNFDLTYYDDNDDEVVIEIPSKWEVCGCCDGEGTTVFGWGGPNGDHHCMTESDRAEDPDFYAGVISGRYDRPCPECKGRSTVRVPNYDALDEKTLQLLHAEEEAEEAFRAECAAESRFFYGY